MNSYSIYNVRKTEMQYNILILIALFLFPLIGFFFFFIFSKYIRNKTFLFVIIYAYIGYSFIAENPLLDSYRYAEQFRSLVDGYRISIIDNLKNGILDIYSLLTMKIVAAITDNSHVLFALWAVVFGYFTADSVNVIEESIPKKSQLLILTILVIIVLLNPPTNINGVRFWTAIWVAFAGFLEYEVKFRKRGMVFMCITPLIHTSFIIFLILYFISRFFKIKKISLWLTLFVISYVLSFVLSATTLADVVSNYLGPTSHFSAYVDESYVNEITAAKASRSSLNIFLTSLPKLFMVIFMLFIVRYKAIEKHNIINKILPFFFIFMIVINIFGIIPSVSRFDKLGYFLFLYIILLYHNYFRSITNLLLSVLIFIVFFGVIFIALEIVPEVLDISILYPVFL